MRIKGWQRNRKYWEQVILSRQSFRLISASICSLSAQDGQAAEAFKKTPGAFPSDCHCLQDWDRHHRKGNPRVLPALLLGAGIFSTPQDPRADHTPYSQQKKWGYFIALCFTTVVLETGFLCLSMQRMAQSSGEKGAPAKEYEDKAKNRVMLQQL